MADDDEVKQEFTWEALEAGGEGEPAGETAKFVKRAGKAKVTYANGDVYEGDFNEAGQKHGNGSYVWNTAEGSNPWLPEEGAPPIEAGAVKYEGGWSEGKKHGVGQIFYPDGGRYHGEWADGVKSGQGTYYYPSGDLYSGTWAGDAKNGKGAYLFKKDGSQLVGEYKDGQLTQGKWVFADGSCFVGRFKDNKPIGKGVFYFPGPGNQQEGEWVEQGDEEDEDAPKTVVWRGGAVTPSTSSAADQTRAPLPPSTA